MIHVDFRERDQTILALFVLLFCFILRLVLKMENLLNQNIHIFFVVLCIILCFLKLVFEQE